MLWGSVVLVKEKEIFFPGYKVIYFGPDDIAEQSSFIISCPVIQSMHLEGDFCLCLVSVNLQMEHCFLQ